MINPLHAELNPIRHLLALVGARHIVHVSRIRVNYVIRPTICTFFMYFALKRLLHVSNRQAVHPQEALFTVYADIGMYHAYKVKSSS